MAGAGVCCPQQMLTGVWPVMRAPVIRRQQSGVGQSCCPHMKPIGESWQAGHWNCPLLLSWPGWSMPFPGCSPVRAVSQEIFPEHSQGHYKIRGDESHCMQETCAHIASSPDCPCATGRDPYILKLPFAQKMDTKRSWLLSHRLKMGDRRISHFQLPLPTCCCAYEQLYCQAAWSSAWVPQLL